MKLMTTIPVLRHFLNLTVVSGLIAFSFEASARSRKLVHEDLSTAQPSTLSAIPMPSAAATAGTGTVTAPAASLSLATAGGNYISADRGPVPIQSFIPYPAAPPQDASLPMLTQAISQFMNFAGRVDAQKNPQNYRDWVDPTRVAAEARAPGYGNITSQALDPQCPNLPAAAVERMKRYLALCQNSLRIPKGIVSIVDFSTNAPVLYLLKKDDLSCVGSTRVTFGTGSHQTQPRGGNVPESNMTPPGFHITKTHNGELYKDWNSIGLHGTGSDNSNTVARGVIMHPVRGTATLGCIGIPESRFAAVKQSLGVGSVVFNYFPNTTNNDSENRCPVYSQRSDQNRSALTRPPSRNRSYAPVESLDPQAQQGTE